MLLLELLGRRRKPGFQQDVLTRLRTSEDLEPTVLDASLIGAIDGALIADLDALNVSKEEHCARDRRLERRVEFGGRVVRDRRYPEGRTQVGVLISCPRQDEPRSRPPVIEPTASAPA